MIGRTRVGLKYLFWGMVVGVLLAPRSGKETRAKLVEKLKGGVDALVSAV